MKGLISHCISHSLEWEYLTSQYLQFHAKDRDMWHNWQHHHMNCTAITQVLNLLGVFLITNEHGRIQSSFVPIQDSLLFPLTIFPLWMEWGHTWTANSKWAKGKNLLWQNTSPSWLPMEKTCKHSPAYNSSLSPVSSSSLTSYICPFLCSLSQYYF